MAGFACREQALLAAPVPYAKIASLAERIYALCDDKDGLKDGLIDDPRRCNFQPGRDLPRYASAVEGSKCFTDAQIGTLEMAKPCGRGRCAPIRRRRNTTDRAAVVPSVH